MSNTPAPKNGNVFSLPRPRRRDETTSYDVERPAPAKNETLTISELDDGPPTIKTLVPEQIRAPLYAPPPGETLGELFKIYELKAGETLQSFFKPIRTAFILLRGKAEELVPDARGELMVVRWLEAGDLVNASLFAMSVDTCGAEVEVRATTDLLMYVVTLDDVEAYDVSDDKRASVRRQRERYVQTALARANIQTTRNRNRLAQDIERAELKAVGAEEAAAADSFALQSAEGEVVQLKVRIKELEATFKPHLDELKEQVLRPIYKKVKDRDRQIAILTEWAETVFKLYPPKRDELNRLRKDRIADTDSMRIMLDEVDNLINVEVKDEHEKRLATLVALVSDALLLMSVSGNSEEAQVAFKTLNGLFTFKMKMGNKPK